MVRCYQYDVAYFCSSSCASENQSRDCIGKSIADIIPLKADSEMKVDCVHAADIALMLPNNVDRYDNESDVD